LFLVLRKKKKKKKEEKTTYSVIGRGNLWRRTGDFFSFLRKGAALTMAVELPCLRKGTIFFFFERENGNVERTEMALAILENKIKTEKRGEDLEAKVFDRMPQREVRLFGKNKKTENV
jgi:hypothetical protein